MSNFELSGDEGLRLYFHNRDNFVDVKYLEHYTHYALQFYNIDNFGFYALVRFKGTSYAKESLLVFPSKTWFNEWLKLEDTDVEILYLSEHHNRKENN